MEKLVSIIIPCYNHSTVVGRMIKSVLNQTYSKIELIVVNDGSTDDSEKVILSFAEKLEEKGYLFKYVKQDNAGLGSAINAGLKCITGEYFCWGDADDFYEIESIEKRVLFLTENEEYAVVTSNAYIREGQNLDNKRVLAKDNDLNRNTDQFLIHLNGDSIFCSGCHMVRTSMFKSVYPDMQIYPAKRGQNWQLLLPLYFRYKRYFMNVPLYNYINYPNSMSKDKKGFESKIIRFNEYEEILNHVIDHIEMIENIDMNQYRKFLDDKYSKMRMEIYIKFGEKENFIKEYIDKQHNVGIDLNDRISVYRMKSKIFRLLYRYGYRLFRGTVPERVPENMLRKIKESKIPKRSEPRVSVLIPVYNGEKYISQCFRCILNQRYRNIEVIAVNTGSTDGTEEFLVKYEPIFKEAGIKYLHLYQENARLAVAMNNALQFITGKYVMIYEIDDILYRDGIIDKVSYMEKNPQISMVRNNGYYIKDFGEMEKELFIYNKKEKDENRVFENILFGHTNNWPASYLIRVDDFFQMTGPEHKVYEHPGGVHLQFMLPMAYNRKVGFIDKPLMDYYIHVDSDSHSGGYEAFLKRSVWYEEIRQEVIKRLNLSEKQLKKYSEKLKRNFNESRMITALNNNDKENYELNARKLGLSAHRRRILWKWKKSKPYYVVSKCKRICSVALRKYHVFYCNIALWKRNEKGYMN